MMVWRDTNRGDCWRIKRINHLDKLNIEGKGMTLRHRRPMIIRRRDDAVHCDSEWQFLR
jgi:hypothetical protein